MELNKEVELIVKMPVNLLSALDEFSVKAGYKNSAELLARFVKRELAIALDIDENDCKLNDIH
jgi:metal-responsive CopG/Arc/MetJ family transcriptional regulator